uniref:Uncharacterized protein n=1 Tax=Anguilla anguilla TaxID=7936 RepID=A0A0E9XKA2_ANGAN
MHEHDSPHEKSAQTCQYFENHKIQCNA